MREVSLSPFHSELLEFLQRDIERRCAEEGFDPASDPQLQALIRGLAPTSSEGPLPLTEILENYQHLFGIRGPISIEKLLMEAFSPKDFIELGLTRYYPRVYRGLPRLYHRDQPSQSHIKRNFTSLPHLKKQAASKAVFSLYSKWPAHGTVTLLTWVIHDGLGDYVAAIEILRLLKGKFPDLKLHLIALVPSGAMAPFSYPENVHLFFYEKECPLSTISPEAISLMRSSDLLLQTPTFYPHTEELLAALQAIDSDLPMPKMECVGEYGFIESSWFHPKSDAYSMGLHFLEKGILVRRPCQAAWEEVRNEKLIQWRSPEHRFYLAYLTTPMGGAIYLHALLKSLEWDDRNIDLCVPDLGWFVQFVEKQNKARRSILQWDLGVSAIEVYFQDQIYQISTASKGKKVRLLCPGQITQSDFRALLALSGEWVAVRGDQSFSEAVSQGKAFFYDGREHARYFIKDLLAIAENRIGAHPSTLACIRGIAQGFAYHIPIQEGQWVDETYFQEPEEWTAIALQMGLALQDPEFLTGYKKLNRIFVEEFSANGFLCHLVQRGLCHHHHPELRAFEAEELNRFANNQQKFPQLIEALKSRL